MAALLLLSACAAEEVQPLPMSRAEAPAAQEETEPLICRIGRGSALFGREWFDFKDVEFSLKHGEHVNVPVPRVRGAQEMTIQAYFDGNGQKLIFCPFLDGAPDKRISCASLYALDEDLRDGIKRTFDIPSAVRGGFITCAYDPAKLRPLSVPATGRH